MSVGTDAPAPTVRRGRTLALDVGEVRVGVAVSDELGAIASPLTMVRRGKSDLDELIQLTREWSPTTVVVGLPTGLSGREGPQAAIVRAFAAKLAARLGETPPIVFWDERLTTAIAERSLIASGTSRAKRKQRIDAVAAAVLLQSYLDAARFRAGRTSQ